MSVENWLPLAPARPAITPFFWYSPTFLSKKLVFPSYGGRKEEKEFEPSGRGQGAEKKTKISKTAGCFFLSYHRDQLHKVEWVLHVIQLAVAQRNHEPIGHELDVDTHQVGVHTNQGARQRIG